MKCPFCHSDCFDNTTNKRNEHSPDFKCKNKACAAAGWVTKDNMSVSFQSGDKSKKQIVPFLEATPKLAPVSTVKIDKPAPVIPQYSNKSVFSDPNVVNKSVFTKWAVDIALASLSYDKTIDEVMDLVKDAHVKLDAFLNAQGIVPVQQPIIPDTIPETASTEAAPSNTTPSETKIDEDDLSGLSDVLASLNL